MQGHSNPNNIISLPTEKKVKLDLSDKITKTYDYMKRIIPEEDVKSVWRGIRSQILVLKAFENAEILFVYSCGSRMTDSFRGRAEKIECYFAADKAMRFLSRSSTVCGVER
mmetsp:Transcript_17610/g.26138  ORF Transcript_17610/g.26138 Transcript_17610/m.26138 type:complete len:111 (+) Transcript_17610:227-559(+)